MKFRPCIDVKNGRVVQIVGSTIGQTQGADTNFEADKPSTHFAELYKADGLIGGHVIALDREPATEAVAMEALEAYSCGLHFGGGVNPENAARFIDAGASHVIVTSYVFTDGQINWDNLKAMKRAVGRDKLVLDLSCRKRDGKYLIVTDRWQKFTDVDVSPERLRQLAEHCDEYLVHGVDVEGKKQGIEPELVQMLGEWDGIPVTYAGGIRGLEDVELIYRVGNGRLDFTIGSALDIFGGKLAYRDAVNWHNAHGK